MSELPACVDDLPNICGSEQRIEEAIRAGRSGAAPTPDGVVRLDDIDAAFAIALHMHQPPIPAGRGDLRTAATISNLRWMMEHRDIGDNHNAPVFLWCYQRMGELIPQLVDEGHRPRVMLDYSGTLLHGLYEMGAREVFDALGRITCDPSYRQEVEWLGAPWGHAVAPSTPSRTSACTYGPGSTTSPPSSASRPWAGSAGSRRRRWRCRTTPTSPTSS